MFQFLPFLLKAGKIAGSVAKGAGFLKGLMGGQQQGQPMQLLGGGVDGGMTQGLSPIQRPMAPSPLIFGNNVDPNMDLNEKRRNMMIPRGFY